MGFNVSQIKYADCAAFSSHIGFESLSLYVLFSHYKICTMRKKAVNKGLLKPWRVGFVKHFRGKFGGGQTFSFKNDKKWRKSSTFAEKILFYNVKTDTLLPSLSLRPIFGFCQSPPSGSDTPASSSFHKKSEKLPWKESVNADIMPVIKKNFNVRAVSSTDS